MPLHNSPNCQLLVLSTDLLLQKFHETSSTFRAKDKDKVTQRRSLYVAVRPSVCRLSVTFVHHTQAIEIFGNVSTPFGKLDIY